MRRVLLTGAEGLIGSVLRDGLGEHYELKCLTRSVEDFPSTPCDITSLSSLVEAFAGAHTIIHLAGSSALDSSWKAVVEANICGTRNVFEAACRAGATSVIYASSGHVHGTAEEEGAPDIYELGHPQVFDVANSPRPDSLYAVSKLFGEALGRYYHDAFGLRVICVRLGMVLPSDDPRRLSGGRGRTAQLAIDQAYVRTRAKWLSHRDCRQLFTCCIEATHTSWAIVYGTSDNPRQVWSLQGARELLGYQPQDVAPLEL
jgi:NAD+ dependent glucose-6-phosphate dehydrogenase